MMMLYFDFSINTSFDVESHEKAFLCQNPMRYPINLHLGICKKSKLVLFYSWHFSGRVQRTAKKDCGACVLKHAWSHFFHCDFCAVSNLNFLCCMIYRMAAPFLSQKHKFACFKMRKIFSLTFLIISFSAVCSPGCHSEHGECSQPGECK